MYITRYVISLSVAAVGSKQLGNFKGTLAFQEALKCTKPLGFGCLVLLVFSWNSDFVAEALTCGTV